MPLFMIAAKDIKQAFDILSIKPGKVTQKHFVEEPERIGSFLYDFKEAFLNYESYYQFDPYRETYLEKDRVPEIKIFSDSISKRMAERVIEENIWIQKYILSLKKSEGLRSDETMYGMPQLKMDMVQLALAIHPESRPAARIVFSVIAERPEARIL